MDPCLEEYKWYMAAFGAITLASILTNIVCALKWRKTKEKTPENVTIPYTQGKGEVEMETFVMHIGGARGSSGVPGWAVKEYLSETTGTSKGSSTVGTQSTDV